MCIRDRYILTYTTIFSIIVHKCASCKFIGDNFKVDACILILICFSCIAHCTHVGAAVSRWAPGIDHWTWKIRSNCLKWWQPLTCIWLNFEIAVITNWYACIFTDLALFDTDNEVSWLWRHGLNPCIHYHHIMPARQWWVTSDDVLQNFACWRTNYVTYILLKCFKPALPSGNDNRKQVSNKSHTFLLKTCSRSTACHRPDISRIHTLYIGNQC